MVSLCEMLRVGIEVQKTIHVKGGRSCCVTASDHRKIIKWGLWTRMCGVDLVVLQVTGFAVHSCSFHVCPIYYLLITLAWRNFRKGHG
jgi:hypothetical protein